MSRIRRNRLNSFDARSVVLFAAIAVSGLGAHAQSPAPKFGAKTSASASRSPGASASAASVTHQASPSSPESRAVFGGTTTSASASAAKTGSAGQTRDVKGRAL